LVRDRIKNYLSKHLLIAQGVTDRDVVAGTGLNPRDPAIQRLKAEMIDARLDGRKWTPPMEAKPAVPAEVRSNARDAKAPAGERAKSAPRAKKQGSGQDRSPKPKAKPKPLPPKTMKTAHR
jgi:hypothetical protein